MANQNNNKGGQQPLRVFMAALRRKIEKDPGNCRFILTEIGVGYRFREATE